MGSPWRRSISPVILILSLNDAHVLCQNVVPSGIPAAVLNEVNRDCNINGKGSLTPQPVNALLSCSANEFPGIVPSLRPTIYQDTQQVQQECQQVTPINGASFQQAQFSPVPYLTSAANSNFLLPNDNNLSTLQSGLLPANLQAIPTGLKQQNAQPTLQNYPGSLADVVGIVRPFIDPQQLANQANRNGISESIILTDTNILPNTQTTGNNRSPAFCSQQQQTVNSVSDSRNCLPKSELPDVNTYSYAGNIQLAPQQQFLNQGVLQQQQLLNQVPSRNSIETSPCEGSAQKQRAALQQQLLNQESKEKLPTITANLPCEERGQQFSNLQQQITINNPPTQANIISEVECNSQCAGNIRQPQSVSQQQSLSKKVSTRYAIPMQMNVKSEVNAISPRRNIGPQPILQQHIQNQCTSNALTTQPNQLTGVNIRQELSVLQKQSLNQLSAGNNIPTQTNELCENKANFPCEYNGPQSISQNQVKTESNRLSTQGNPLTDVNMEVLSLGTREPRLIIQQQQQLLPIKKCVSTQNNLRSEVDTNLQFRDAGLQTILQQQQILKELPTVRNRICIESGVSEVNLLAANTPCIENIGTIPSILQQKQKLNQLASSRLPTGINSLPEVNTQSKNLPCAGNIGYTPFPTQSLVQSEVNTLSAHLQCVENGRSTQQQLLLSQIPTGNNGFLSDINALPAVNTLQTLSGTGNTRPMSSSNLQQQNQTPTSRCLPCESSLQSEIYTATVNNPCYENMRPTPCQQQTLGPISSNNLPSQSTLCAGNSLPTNPSCKENTKPKLSIVQRLLQSKQLAARTNSSAESNVLSEGNSLSANSPCVESTTPCQSDLQRILSNQQLAGRNSIITESRTLSEINTLSANSLSAGMKSPAQPSSDPAVGNNYPTNTFVQSDINYISPNSPFAANKCILQPVLQQQFLNQPLICNALATELSALPEVNTFLANVPCTGNDRQMTQQPLNSNIATNCGQCLKILPEVNTQLNQPRIGCVRPTPNFLQQQQLANEASSQNCLHTESNLLSDFTKVSLSNPYNLQQQISNTLSTRTNSVPESAVLSELNSITSKAPCVNAPHLQKEQRTASNSISSKPVVISPSLCSNPKQQQIVYQPPLYNSFPYDITAQSYYNTISSNDPCTGTITETPILQLQQFPNQVSEIPSVYSQLNMITNPNCALNTDYIPLPLLLQQLQLQQLQQEQLLNAFSVANYSPTQILSEVTSQINIDTLTNSETFEQQQEFADKNILPIQAENNSIITEESATAVDVFGNEKVEVANIADVRNSVATDVPQLAVYSTSPENILVDVPPASFPGPTVTLVPTLPPFVYPPMPPIIVEGSRSKLKSLLPILLVALMRDGGGFFGENGC